MGTDVLRVGFSQKDVKEFVELSGIGFLFNTWKFSVLYELLLRFRGMMEELTLCWYTPAAWLSDIDSGVDYRRVIRI